ncbi:MAG: cation transporter [Alphaproteobacteria bacterium]|nr:cation transporter [Alphaproteobacteria bacterium]
MDDSSLRRAVRFVGLANFAYFFVEFAVALHIGSVSLFADSVDFLEDASVNFLILLALGWSLKARARIGMGLAALLLWPAIATLWMVWHQFTTLTPPDPILLSATGAGALVVNLTCAYRLAKYRHHSGSLTKAAFLSARNDAFANIGIIFAGFITLATHSAWPDLIVGLAIAAMNIDAAKEVWTAAKEEHLEAKS